MRTRERGQALVETALVLPVLMLLLAGVYTASELISAQNMATSASRNAARLGAELGNEGYQPGVSPRDPTGVDQRVVAAVTSALNGRMAQATLTEVDVYRPDPAQPAGYFSLTDPALLIDRYTPDGIPAGALQYGLDARSQVPNQESQLGVRVTFDFRPPAVVFGLFAGSHSAYSVFTMPPR